MLYFLYNKEDKNMEKAKTNELVDNVANEIFNHLLIKNLERDCKGRMTMLQSVAYTYPNLGLKEGSSKDIKITELVNKKIDEYEETKNVSQVPEEQLNNIAEQVFNLKLQKESEKNDSDSAISLLISAALGYPNFGIRIGTIDDKVLTELINAKVNEYNKSKNKTI